MSIPIRTVALLAGAAVLLAAGLVLVGRLTAGHSGGRAAAYSAGQVDGYANGLQRGEAQGRQEGRALQEGSELPPNSRQPAQDAFDAGYAAGAADAFGGYDGGWALSTPYLVTIGPGSGQITYRFASRTTVEAGVNYYLCPDGHSICTEHRP